MAERDAFTAGVKPGGLTNSTEIRLLLCYLVRCAGPLLPCDAPTRPLREAALGDGDDLLARAPLPMGMLHPRALQGAAPGLARERLRGDEPVVLENLHPQQAELRFRLPGELPRIQMRPPELKVMSPKVVLQTLRIEPDRGRITLTWIGVLPLAAPPSREFVERTEAAVTWSRLD